MNKTLAVVSHIGQLNKLKVWAKDYSKDLDLYILYTSANVEMPDKVASLAKQSDFINSHTLIKIPRRPNYITFKKANTFKKVYEKIFDHRSNKDCDLIVFSFERHYNLLIRSFRRHSKGLLSLIEEGTATYKILSTPKNYKESSLKLSKSEYYKLLLRIYRKNIKSNILLMLLKYPFRLFCVLYILCKKLFLHPCIQITLIRKCGLELEEITSYNRNFDRAYLTFPGLLDQQLRIKETHQFTSIYVEECMPTACNISKFDGLYISQRYNINSSTYAKYLVDQLSNLLAKYSLSRIVIKLHPKEKLTLLPILTEAIEHCNMDNKISIFEDQDITAETIIKYCQPNFVIGLTSTVLAYTPHLSPQTQVISLARPMINTLILQTNKAAIDEFKEHLAILEKFDGIHYI